MLFRSFALSLPFCSISLPFFLSSLIDIRMQKQIPPELLSIIFHSLRVSADYTSLQACTQANSLFRAIAERHLYHNLALTDRDAKTPNPLYITQRSLFMGFNPSEVLSLLSKRPQVAGYVRSLVIMMEYPSSLSLAWNPSKRDLWVKATVQVFHLLTKLDHVVLKPTSRGDGRMLWQDLGQDLQHALVGVLTRPSLRALELTSVDKFPFETLCTATALERLTLNRCLGSAAGQDLVAHSNPPSTRPQLTSLSLKYDRISEITSWLNSSIGLDISSLVELRATLQGASDYMHLSYILSNCSETMKMLELNPGHDG